MQSIRERTVQLQSRLLLRQVRSVGATAVLLTFAVVATAQIPKAPGAAQTLEELTPGAAQTLFDDAWKTNLSDGGRIPGAVVTVVKDGQIVFEKGYGFADIATRRPADPRETYLRIGSVSKVFSALTALTLVGDGTLNLDTDVNTYLKDVKVPATFPSPVTVRSLLSHLSGFDAGISGWMVDSNADLRSPPAELQRRLIRIHPDGLVYAYDNRGVGLLGHIIGEVSGGKSFAEVMKARVFDPLGMTHSYMGMPDAIASKVATCYTVDKADEVETCKYQHMREDIQAAGDVTTTGSDMGRFMMALLNGGELDGKRILRPALFQQFMNADTNRLNPLLLGMGFIIFERDIDGRRTMGHNGGMQGFSTDMELFPESNVGVFISLFTSYTGIPEHDDTWTYRIGLWERRKAIQQVNQYYRIDVVMRSFADRFIRPTPRHSNLTAPTHRTEALATFAGDYDSANADVYPIRERMFLALSDPLHLKVAVHGQDVFIAGQGPFRETQPYVFEAVGNPVRWVFIPREGHVLLSNTLQPIAATWLKEEDYISGDITVIPLFVAIALCLSAGIYALARRGSAMRPVARILFWVGLAALIGLVLEFQFFPGEYFRKGGSLFMYGWRLLINLSWLGALVAAGITAFRYSSWARWSTLAGSIESAYVSLLVLSAIVIILLFPYWGFIGNFTH